jgi:LmbE family N-acetylglucosaminyl deacetylase
MKNILCIAAHPDDEILGFGATLAKHAEKGDAVYVVIAAEGITSRDTQRNTDVKSDEFKKLYECTEKANKILGVKKVQFLAMPDNRMDSLDLLDIVKKVEEVIKQIQPSVVYTHFQGDLNVDHQILNRAVLTACRPQPGYVVKEIYAGEVPSATHWNPSAPAFNPNCFVNVESTLAKKLEALRIYESEMRAFPHARSLKGVEALAHWRGSQSGSPAAEAFEILRLLKD